jgi:two-component system, chemotaxis family, chemotaxis protein CheY
VHKDDDIKILIADDTDFIRKSVISTLGEIGFTNISEVKDGVQALSELKKSKYDLLISDLNMPHLDGISLIRMIKGDPELKDIMIIMLTAESEKEHVLAVKEIGVNDYIVKPFTANVLEKKIEQLFGKRRSVTEGLGWPEKNS